MIKIWLGDEESINKMKEKRYFVVFIVWYTKHTWDVFYFYIESEKRLKQYFPLYPQKKNTKKNISWSHTSFWLKSYLISQKTKNKKKYIL